MAAQAQKPRRRIVPQLITSPNSQDRDEDALPIAEKAEAAAPPAVDQREQSEWAREHLGHDRKVFLDLSALSNTEIDWKQICKERGVQKAKKTTAVENNGEANDPLLLRGRTGRQEDSWSRLLAKLEATYCLGAESEEEEDADRDEEGSESGASDDEADEEGGKGASDGGEGGREGGEGGSGREGGEGKKKGPKNDYDYMDDWIDDEEFIQLVAHDKRRPKHSGFFISKGEIERTEELLPGFEDLEKERKRGGGGGSKRKAEAGDDGVPATTAAEAKQGAAAAGEKKKRKQAEPAGEGGEGAGSEGKAPKKKKQKAAAEAGAAPNDKPQSIAEVARMAGQLAAAGAAPTIAVLTASSPAKKKAHYEMPPEVAASIQAIREVASRQPVPAPAPPAAAAPAEGGEEGGKKSRRVLPKAIKDALFSFSATFLAEVEKHSSPASNRIMDELLAFLEPFASRPSILNYLRNANKEREKKAVQEAKPAEAPKGLSEDEIKAMIREKVKPLPEGSDDDFEAPAAPRGSAPPSGTQGTASQAAAPEKKGPNKFLKALDRKVQEQVYLYMKSRLQGQKVQSQTGKLLQSEVYNWFPRNSIDQAAIVSIYNTFKNRERRQAEKAAQQAGAASAGATPPTAAAAATGAEQLLVPDPGIVASPEDFAALAIASAQKKLGQAEGGSQPEAQEATASMLVAAAAPQAAVPPAGPPPAAVRQMGDVSAAAAAEAEEALAAAAATTPKRPQLVAQQLQQPPQPVAEQQQPKPQQAVAEQQPQQQQTPQPLPPAQHGAQQQQQAQPQAGVPLMSDDDVVAAGVRHGAAEGELRQLLATSQAAKPAPYAHIFTKLLMMAGQQGLTTAEAVNKGVEMGFTTRDASTQHFKNQLAKASHHPWVAYIGESKYTLRCFPGVQPCPRPSRGSRLAAAAADSEEALAAAAAITPQRPQVVLLQQQPHQVPPQQQRPVAAQQSPQPPPPAQQGDQQAQTQAAVPLMSDDDVVAAGVRHGAAEQELRQLLATSQAAKPAPYAHVFTKLMMVVGQQGLTTAEAASKGVEMGFATWDGAATHIKNQLAKASHSPWVAYIGASKYTLRCFPGVQPCPRPTRGSKKADLVGLGSSGTGSSPLPAIEAAAGEAALDASQA